MFYDNIISYALENIIDISIFYDFCCHGSIPLFFAHKQAYKHKTKIK